MKPTDIKQILEDILHEIMLNPISYVCDPQKNFSRTRKLLCFDPKMDFILTDLFCPFRNNVQKIKIDFIHFP